MTFCQNLLISSTPAFTELITSSSVCLSVCLSVCPSACPSVATCFSFLYVLWWPRTIHVVSLYRSSFADCFVITRFLGLCSDFNLPSFSLCFYLGSWNFNQFWSDKAIIHNLIKICCYNELHFPTLYNIWTKSIRGQVQVNFNIQIFKLGSCPFLPIKTIFSCHDFTSCDLIGWIQSSLGNDP